MSGFSAQLESGRTILATEYVRAKRFADDMRATVEAQFASVDLLLSPAVPFVAPFTDPVIEEGEEGEMLSSGLANLTGHPALNLPAGLAEGLPIGLQLIGAHGQDSRLLSLAAALEAVLEEEMWPNLGLGKRLGGKIRELVRDGSMKFYVELRADLPPAVDSLMHVHGVGPKLAVRLHKELGVTNPIELADAARRGQVVKLPGFGRIGLSWPVTSAISAESDEAIPAVRRVHRSR